MKFLEHINDVPRGIMLRFNPLTSFYKNKTSWKKPLDREVRHEKNDYTRSR